MIKDKIIELIDQLDSSNVADKRTLEHIYSLAYQKKIALELGHQFVDAESYDAISQIGKKIEYKSVFVCSLSNMTISNLNNKEDVILYVAPNVCDKNEHWFYFPKFELNNVYGINKYEWVIIDNDKEFNNVYGKFVDNNLSRGKSMPPKNYLYDDNYTWRKGYMRAREYSKDNIIKLSNMSDDEIKKYISYTHNKIEKEYIENEL